MVQSIFEVYKTSLGPSSSHTTGPMKAARDFTVWLHKKGFLEEVFSLKVKLYGSLAATGRGHGTGKAILLGLMGFTPESINPYKIEELLHEQEKSGTINLLQIKEVPFECPTDLLYDLSHDEPLFHPNTLHMEACDIKGTLLAEESYYSIGGGEILKGSEKEKVNGDSSQYKPIPHPFESGTELFSICTQENITVAELTLKNECALRSESEVYEKLDFIQKTMESCITKGCATSGVLPGGLKVKRRAHNLYEQLIARKNQGEKNDPTEVLDWVNLYALAVNEENAAGSKIITAPTNGAAGVVPAVLQYYKHNTASPTPKGAYDFLLTAASIGILYMNKASISGAEVGCQGEVGVACSMAAGGLTAALGGTVIQIEKAAEIGMEHNLGLTCDPVGGLVQIPCIERNAMASTKAINACRLALVTNEPSHVSLDDVIHTMYQTGLDMKMSYKETSLGGLAVNVKNC